MFTYYMPFVYDSSPKSQLFGFKYLLNLAIYETGQFLFLYLHQLINSAIHFLNLFITLYMLGKISSII